MILVLESRFGQTVPFGLFKSLKKALKKTRLLTERMTEHNLDRHYQSQGITHRWVGPNNHTILFYELEKQ